MALGLVAAVAGASATLAPSASAAGVLPTTTTLAAAPAASTAGDTVTLTATVKVLGLPGLGVTPTGPVAFTASNGSGTTALGTSPIGSCLLTTCTAALSTTGIPAGSTTVTATYAGDTLAAASSGSAPVTVAVPPDAKTTKTCLAGEQTCNTETISSDDGKTSLQVSSNGGGQTVTAALYQEGGLHCDTRNPNPPGALAEFDNTSPTASKLVTYTVRDAAAWFLAEEYWHSDGQFVGCYGSPNPFKGFIPGASEGSFVYGDALWSPQDQLYVARLARCVEGIATPCFTVGNIGWVYGDVEIHTPAGDPRFT